MSNNDTNEADDSPVAVFADYDHSRTNDHGEDVDEEEQVRKASRYFESDIVLACAKTNVQGGVADQAVVQGTEMGELCPRRYILCR